MSTDPNSSLNAEALYAKSQVYIARGFRAQKEDDYEEYQLWASLALELLSKAALANVHPSLIADPSHYQSIFAACGKPIAADTRTITAKTLFSRLTHLDKAFDKRHQTFCEQIAIRRNVELHSGESPFSGMSAQAWEREFWSAAKCILEMQSESLESWLGAEDSAAPDEVVQKAQEALEWAVKDRITRHKEKFDKTHQDPAKRQSAVKKAESLHWWQNRKVFREDPEGCEDVQCPSCECQGFLAGVLWNEEVTPPDDPDEFWYENVTKTFTAEEFVCPTCELQFFGTEELAAASLPSEFEQEEVREIEFEPDYGND